MDIGSVANLISGQHIDASDYNCEQRGIGYLTGPSDFGERSPIVTKWTERPKRTALRGDILITVKGSGVGSVNIMEEEELAISRQLMAVRVNSTDPSLVYYALEAGSEYFQSLANGAAIPGISRADVLSFKVAVPPEIELPRVMRRLHYLRSSAAQLTEVYRQKIDCLTALKQSILHRAFNGELTATIAETIAA
jgi:type I restriction enzyme S subunit